MAFNKDQAQSANYAKFYGIDKESSILLPFVNLTNERKTDLGLKVFDNESEYIKIEEKDGLETKNITIELYIKKVKSSAQEMNGKIFPIRFYIKDQYVPQGSTSGKFQFINEMGDSFWAESQEDCKVTDRFRTLNGLRRAYVGEVALLEAFNQMFHVKASFTPFDLKKVFAGNFNEIEQTIKDVTADRKEKNQFKEFSILHAVKRTEKTNETGEVKTYYNEVLLPQYGFNTYEINKDLKYVEDNNKMGDFHYRKDGVLLNKLTEFVEGVDFSDTTTDTADSTNYELPTY